MNKVDRAIDRADTILKECGIWGWSVEVRNTRKALAVTDHSTSIVELSKRFILASTLEEFDGLIHHEVAHIIVGPGKGHGEEFVRVCKAINPNEQFSCESFPIFIQKYKYVCEYCGDVGCSEKAIATNCSKCLSEHGRLVPLDVVKNVIIPKEWASTP